MRYIRLNSWIFIILFTYSCDKKIIETPVTQFQVEPSEMTDTRDGQIYKIVKIGNQWWMAENLNYYTSSGSWYYNNDSIKYSKPYGRLYLWRAAMNLHASSSSNPSNVQGISPNGWHIPSLSEWNQLENYLKSFGLCADDLKDVGTSHWPTPNYGTNLTFFNAIPTGTVYNNGNSFANINYQTTFLTSTIDENTGGVWGRGIDCDKSDLRIAPLGLQNGWSVRCVKDK
jgi:uncharacterized protein (TIGR02145 family)